MTERARSDPARIEAAWRRFEIAHGRELGEWLAAERALAEGLELGHLGGHAGDRLIVAEAALQSAMVDFAAVEEEGADPTGLALGLLKRAEDLLGKG